MRKLLLIPAATVYFFLATGVHLQLRYCCGEVIQINFLEWNSCCHPEAGELDSCQPDQSSCCQTSEFFIHLSNDQQSSPGVLLQFWKPVMEFPEEDRLVLNGIPPLSAHLRAGDSSPPGPSLYKMHCQFVFYA